MRKPRKSFWLCNTPHGTIEALGGLVEYDPHWRQRGLLQQFEAEFHDKKLTKAQIAALASIDTCIEFICGKPGGGKSMYATKLIIDELINGKRPIVTNLALNLGRLQEYLDELGHKVHVVERVRLLQKEEITEFYLRRGVDFTLSLPPEGERFMDWTPSQNDERSAGGVMYVLDECHNYLHPAAFGQKLTPEHPLMQYATQHRKLKDSCYLVTQSVENVHVQVRRLGQQFSYIRNLRKETFRGFRRGEGFSRTVYLVPPSSTEAVPIDSNEFKLDVRGLASCYFTAGGVGIAAAGTGDGGAKKKGLNLKWLYVFALGGVVVAGVALLYGARFGSKALLDSTIAKKPGVLLKTEKSPEIHSEEKSAIAKVEDVRPGEAAAQATPEQKWRIRGFTMMGDDMLVCFSDGSPGTGAFKRIVAKVGVDKLQLEDGRLIDRREFEAFVR